MTAKLCRTVCALLLAGIASAIAAPLVPSGALPGRERERFTPSPLDRFFDPRGATQRNEQLYRWNCEQGKPTRLRRQGRKRDKGC